MTSSFSLLPFNSSSFPPSAVLESTIVFMTDKGSQQFRQQNTCSRTTHPERHFQIFASPNVHAFVVGAYFAEVVGVNGEKAAGHGRRSQRLRSVTVPPVHFSLGYAVPGTTRQSIKIKFHRTVKNGSHHRKLSFQLKPPHVMSEAVTYSKVSSEMTSIIGHTTVFLIKKTRN